MKVIKQYLSIVTKGVPSASKYNDVIWIFFDRKHKCGHIFIRKKINILLSTYIYIIIKIRYQTLLLLMEVFKDKGLFNCYLDAKRGRTKKN